MDFISDIIRRDSFVIEYGSHVRDSIIIVLEGQFTCTIHGHSYTAFQNDICVFCKDTLFERKVLTPIRCVYIQFAEFPTPLRSGLLKTADPARTENTIRHLLQAVTEQNKELTEHFLRDIFLLHQPPEAALDPADPIVSGCIAYFSSHCAERITLDMLAEKFSISKQGLIRKFKKVTRKTPMEYLAYIRVDQSKLLLRDTALSVSEIAGKCGFANVYYFSNCFKGATGLSPTAYRSLLDL